MYITDLVAEAAAAYRQALDVAEDQEDEDEAHAAYEAVQRRHVRLPARFRGYLASVAA